MTERSIAYAQCDHQILNSITWRQTEIKKKFKKNVKLEMKTENIQIKAK